MLRRGVDTLTDRQITRLAAALATGDPDGEVAVAWQCAQRARAVYQRRARTRDAGAPAESSRCCPAARSPRSRVSDARCAPGAPSSSYHDTGGASNGPTEAINLLIERNRRAAHGFRNFRNYR